MIPENTLQKIEALVSEVAAREGVKVYDVEFAGGAQGRTLRVFIDKDKGIGIEDCANVSRGLNAALDEQLDLIPGGQYNLEVSSPGLERPLKKLWHFEAAVGKKIWIKTSQALEAFGCQNPKIKNAKQITEVLSSVEDVNLKFQIEDEVISVPWQSVEKAKMVFDFKEGKQEKKGPHPKGAKKK